MTSYAWKTFRNLTAGCVVVTAMATWAVSAHAAQLVTNGSLETLGGPFVDAGLNYMTLANGSTYINGWTVSSSSGPIVLGRTITGDGNSAANGSYFTDLSGYGAASNDGAINQKIRIVTNATYTFSMDLLVGNTGTVAAFVDGLQLSLTGGAPFSVNGTTWQPFTATFVGGSNVTPNLRIADLTPGSRVDFVDNISVIGLGVPEAATWAMMLVGFGCAGSILRSRRRVQFSQA